MKWKQGIEVDIGFWNHGREEAVIEITNEDRSEIFGYSVKDNAALIAAAPAMLEALQENTAHLVALYKMVLPHLIAPNDRVNKAIKKSLNTIKRATTPAP